VSCCFDSHCSTVLAYTQNTIRKIQAIKGWYSATTYTTRKKFFLNTQKNEPEMVLHLNAKNRRGKKSVVAIFRFYEVFAVYGCKVVQRSITECMHSPFTAQHICVKYINKSACMGGLLGFVRKLPVDALQLTFSR